MGTKNNPGRFDCYAQAAPDEPMFVLLGRDPLAPGIVAEWAKDRAITRGYDDKVQEALDCAEAMAMWCEAHGGAPYTRDPMRINVAGLRARAAFYTALADASEAGSPITP